MTQYKNELGQEIGYPLTEWKACEHPSKTSKTTKKKLLGHYCRVEILNIEEHAEDLFLAFANDEDHSNWTYLPYGPFDGDNGFDKFKDWLKMTCSDEDPLFHSVIDVKTNKAVGLVSLMRIQPEVGVMEVGHIHFSPLMQRTPISTEALYLLMKRVFDELAYRRYEWKCDSLNTPSCNAAKRLGFTPEGIFRQLTMYKGRNRDTAWFAIIDSEWPLIKSMFEAWLAPSNFDDKGQQIHSLNFLKP